MKRSWTKIWSAGLVVAAAALTALAPAATAETLVETQTTDVTVPIVGKATPYPSKLEVEGGDGRIADINVQLSLSATFGEDLDIALVSPSGNAEVLMSDVCGGSIGGITLTLDSQSGSSLPNIGPCGSGTFKPTNNGGGDTWEGGPSVESASLTSFNNEDPNGNWELFVVDDLEPGGGSSTITSWSVTITTETAEIVIPGTGGSGKGNPYPSTKAFDTPPGKVISDLNLNFSNYSHMWPEDVDALLTGPRRGATVLAMSDTCGDENDAIHNFQWVFDDEAIPSMGTTEESCFPIDIKPSNIGGDDTFPAPAPGGPYGSAMSAFDGLEGGQFQLFINDDAGPDTGFLTSWGLTVATRDAANTGFVPSSTRIEEGGKAILEVKRSGPADLGPATVNVSIAGGGGDLAVSPSVLEFARGEGAKKVEVAADNDKIGEPTERFTVILSAPQDDARLTAASSTEVVIGPDNEFKFGKLKRNAKKGTAKLFLSLPGPGKITTKSKGVKRINKTFKKGGKAVVLLKPKGKALNQLLDEGSAKVALKITFTPVDGSALTSTRKAKLILND